MKRLVLPQVLAACSICTAILFSSVSALAADPATATASATAPAKLPYGVEDVLKLSRAQVGDDTIVNFVQNSGTVYNLSANDVVYLRSEGVSDRVINAMLEQKKKFVDAAGSNTVPPQSATAPPPPADQPAPPATQPAPVYVQPPATPPASSVYVVPYPDATYAYYGYYRPYPYYYYPGYYGPSISLGFRFGGGYGHHYGGGWGHHYGRSWGHHHR